jgi:hypothetical protein
VNELAHSGSLQLVHEEGADTLVLRASFTDVVIDIGSNSDLGVDNPKPVSAQGVVFFDLIDAETGVIQARIGERVKCAKKTGGEPGSDTDPRWTNVSSCAEHAAADLRAELERVRNENPAAHAS